MAEEQKKNNEEADVEEIDDGETIPCIYWLFEIWENVNNIDTAMLGRERKKQVEQWKERIWDSLNHYINQLQDTE